MSVESDMAAAGAYEHAAKEAARIANRVELRGDLAAAHDVRALQRIMKDCAAALRKENAVALAVVGAHDD